MSVQAMDDLQLAVVSARANICSLLDRIAEPPEQTSDGGPNDGKITGSTKPMSASMRANVLSKSKHVMRQLLVASKTADSEFAACQGEAEHAAARDPQKRRRLQIQQGIDCSASMLRCFAAAASSRVPKATTAPVITKLDRGILEDGDNGFDHQVQSAVKHVHRYRLTAVITDKYFSVRKNTVSALANHDSTDQQPIGATATTDILPEVAGLSGAVIAFGFVDGFKCFLRVLPAQSQTRESAVSVRAVGAVVGAINFLSDAEADERAAKAPDGTAAASALLQPASSKHVVYRALSDSARLAALHYSNESRSTTDVLVPLLRWLSHCETVFRAPCVVCGKLLGLTEPDASAAVAMRANQSTVDANVNFGRPRCQFEGLGPPTCRSYLCYEPVHHGCMRGGEQRPWTSDRF
eukprot:SAG31_NODE_5396_length_2564_cov_1.180122_3_plen_409_part_00